MAESDRWRAEAEAYIRCNIGEVDEYPGALDELLQLCAMVEAATREEMRRDGASLIAAERRRQVEVEGWTPEHDTSYTYGELVEAAECYSYAARTGVLHPPRGWPWEPWWWKPADDPIRNLVKAGALIAAEIDRLRRAQARGTSRRLIPLDRSRRDV